MKEEVPASAGVEVTEEDLTYETTEKTDAPDTTTKLEDDAEVITPEEDNDTPEGFWARRARGMARSPWIHFLVALIISVVISVVGFIAGDFSVTADNAGWQSRGTLIADRQTQALLVLTNRDRLFYDTNNAWEDLINNVQPGWQNDDEDDRVDAQGGGRRRALSSSPSESRSKIMTNHMTHRATAFPNHHSPFRFSEGRHRRMEEAAAVQAGLEGCDASWYTFDTLTSFTHLWPIWETSEPSISALDPEVIRDICIAEEKTTAVLEANKLCVGCSDGSCMPPYSLVFFARLTIGDTNFTKTCDEVAAAWAPLQAETEAALQTCVADIKAAKGFVTVPDSCPFGFSPTLVDEAFGPDNANIRYTSSIFPTNSDWDRLYDLAGDYDRGSKIVHGVYDTQYEDFVNKFSENAVAQDMLLAMGSAVITSLAILVHTRSPWLTLVGLVQIILSFPLAYFVYTFLGQLDFFPFLNFIGVFVVFALGADDIFVAVDKWKNARIADPEGTVEDVAAKALPDAAGAMFLTTFTTAVAFFATAICPVAPLKCFAVFNGLLIVFDYFMCVVLVFPALCLYDKWNANGCCIPCCVMVRCGKNKDTEDDIEEANAVDGKEGEKEEKKSLIHRILLGFYGFLHFARWPLLVICIGALVASAISAATLDLPNSSDVRILSGSIQYERNYEWRQKLLSSVLDKSSGSDAIVIWGVKPADTGTQTNPDSWSQLVLDPTFDPSTEEAQAYLLGFCGKFFAEEFISKTSESYVCSINAFDSWLQEQSQSATPTDEYTANCGGVSGVPMAQPIFNKCIVSWSKLVGQTNVLSRDGVVEIMWVRFQSRARYDSPYDDLNREWNLIEDYLENQRKIAPPTVNKMFHSSEDFWWYDTNGSMLRTAYSAAAIALGAAGIVVLLSSRSIVLTIFALFTIGYVLASTTAMLVASGWTLGFLESVCFAILIGISCDFVIHFGHAYAHLKEGDRHERTKHALITMGPSILAAGFTTMCSAAIMLFTVITFFQKFAIILFYTVIQALLGSFIVYLTLSDTIGPSHPTYLCDLIVAKINEIRKGPSTEE